MKLALSQGTSSIFHTYVPYLCCYSRFCLICSTVHFLYKVIDPWHQLEHHDTLLLLRGHRTCHMLSIALQIKPIIYALHGSYKVQHSHQGTQGNSISTFPSRWNGNNNIQPSVFPSTFSGAPKSVLLSHEKTIFKPAFHTQFL